VEVDSAAVGGGDYRDVAIIIIILLGIIFIIVISASRAHGRRRRRRRSYAHLLFNAIKMQNIARITIARFIALNVYKIISNCHTGVSGVERVSLLLKAYNIIIV